MPERLKGLNQVFFGDTLSNGNASAVDITNSDIEEHTAPPQEATLQFDWKNVICIVVAVVVVVIIGLTIVKTYKAKLSKMWWMRFAGPMEAKMHKDVEVDLEEGKKENGEINNLCAKAGHTEVPTVEAGP